VLPEDSAQFTSQKNRIPCSRPKDVIYHLDAHLSKASSVRTTRTFRLDLPLCREASNCSSFHPSRRFKSTSGRHSVFDQLWDFLPKQKYGKIVAIVRTLWTPVRTRSYGKYCIQNPDVWTLLFMVRTREHQIWKLRASDQPSRLPFLWSRRSKPWYGNYVQRKCDCPDDRASHSECGSNRDKISATFWKAGRTVVRPDDA
jgi:hypothetical protein